jgi:hypothetical protein
MQKKAKNDQNGLKNQRSNWSIRQIDQIGQMSLFSRVVRSVKRVKSVNDFFRSEPHVTHLTFLF